MKCLRLLALLVVFKNITSFKIIVYLYFLIDKIEILCFLASEPPVKKIKVSNDDDEEGKYSQFLDLMLKTKFEVYVEN